MRATIRITWLLLSLSFLLHNVSSDGTDPTDSSVSKSPTTAATVAVVVTSVGSSGTETTKKMDSTTGAPPTEKPTQAPTTIKPTSTPPPPTVVANTQTKPTDNPATTQPQTPAVTNKPASDPTTISGGPSAVEDTTVPATTPRPPKPTTPAATADSSRPSVVAPSAATTQKPEAPVTTQIPVTEVTNRPTGSTSKVETTQDPKVLTYASTQTQKPVAHTTNPSLTSQGNGKQGTEKTTVTVKSHEQTTLKTPEPAVITGTTSSNPSTPTKAGLPPVATPKEATTSLQTTTVRTTRATTTVSQPRTFLYSLNTGHETDEEKELVDVCKRLMVNLQDGNCTLKLQHHNGKIQFDSVEIHGKVKTSLAAQYYEEITKKPTDNKTLIAILASCGALLIMIVILAVCASHRRKPYNENQQHLTEELHTVENGYHDNPTLEVMEVQPEMQEKKMPLNGEFNDSWIVPMDNLPKGCEDIPEEEDTHL